MLLVMAGPVPGDRSGILRRATVERVKKPHLTPGPHHPISVTPNPHRVTVAAGDRTIADTKAALTLQEASYRPVLYIPREDVDMSLLEPTSHHTFCPYKGEASYFTVTTESGALENAVWCYEEPSKAVAEIAGYLAFYPDRVTISEG